jgi:hypothetical protein
MNPELAANCLSEDYSAGHEVYPASDKCKTR